MVTQSDPAGDATHVTSTVGVPVPHTELRIVGTDGRIASCGEVGEVCVRSPLTMLGYWDMPGATSDVFDADGFLHTGDLGSIDDDGVVRIHGRAREVIIRGGENVYPIEVEDVLLRHLAVAAVAVVAAPSERWGEEVAAVVKLVAPGAATADELMHHTAKALAHFKVPRHWRFIDAFPMTASGKIRKVELPAFDEHTRS
jgi:fatty-acyl-CoA synthase